MQEGESSVRGIGGIPFLTGAGGQSSRGFCHQLSGTETIGSSNLSLPTKIFGFWTLPWDLKFDSIGLSRSRGKIKCGPQSNSGDKS